MENKVDQMTHSLIPSALAQGVCLKLGTRILPFLPKKKKHRAGEIAQQIRALDASPKDLGSVSSMTAYNCNSSPREF